MIETKGENRKTGVELRPQTPALANQEKRIYPDDCIILQNSTGYNKEELKMNKNENVSIITELENVSRDITNITQCLDIIENSMYFANERTDKDISKACSAAVEIVIRMLNDTQGNIENVITKLERS